jgi:hypothetical protein
MFSDLPSAAEASIDVRGCVMEFTQAETGIHFSR